MIDHKSGLIKDGLVTLGDCSGVGSFYTYNQGIFLVAYAKLSKLTGNLQYEQQAKITMKAILEPNGPFAHINNEG
eukprot:CAMPEP_0201283134 /NCGR_PEP_ID=MMETSP1317-20130820/7719_1 /ASSEMBLY_ACC=CAM_ASM_000770 /TAXON_ID=187299 /ORGANISM="Undescribed Undescribed, Strain Undescribed" /LENGTH=74 /DNA_ID=CAMNT_0047598329 /DNA_START=59 /DNA_END=283 /DNA_ORIENTATION=+